VVAGYRRGVVVRVPAGAAQMSKLTLHCQAIPGWASEFVRRSGVQYIKLIDPPTQNPYPGCKVIARYYLPDGDSNALVALGAVGADQWFEWMMPRLRRWAYAHEGPNEPQPMADRGFRCQLDAFTVRLVERMNVARLRLVGHNWGVGWLDVGHAKEFVRSVTALADGGHLLGLHEYSAPAMWNGQCHYCLRYRSTLAELRAAGARIPQVIVGECGIDGGVLGQAHARKGWKSFCHSESEYLEQLKWYDSELMKDPEVETACIFTAGPDNLWFDFEVTQPLAWALADYIAATPTPQPDLAARGIDVSDWQGDINWQAVKGSGVSFAMIRASVGRDNGSGVTDGQFARNWREAGRVGLPRGAYHYLHPLPMGQAGIFAQSIGNDRPELGYWCDVEEDALTWQKVSAFLDAADARFGCSVGVYTRASFWNPLDAPADVSLGRPLWVADWRDVDAPAIPNGWTAWDFWQYRVGTAGTVPGIVTRIDLDRYRGSTIELQNLYGLLETPEESEPPQEPDEPETGGGMIYRDRDGNEITEAAFRAVYGDGIQVESSPSSQYRAIEIWDSGLDVGMDCQVELRNAPGPVTVTMYWPDGSVQLERKEPNLYEGLFFACYAPPDVGAYSIHPFKGDAVHGLGWICATSHRHPQRIVFEYIGEPEPPDEEEPPDDDEQEPPPELPEVAQAIALIREAQAKLDEALVVLGAS